MKDESKDKFLEYFSSLFQITPQILEEQDNSNISIYIFKDIPEPNFLTIISYGLSTIDYPSWVNGRPELMLVIEGSNIEWAKSLLNCIMNLRGVFSFSYGQIIRFDEPLTSDTNMSAFFVFAPSIFDKMYYSNIEIAKPYKINLVEIYPIFQTEIDYINTYGLKKFMYHEKYDMYKTDRTEIRE